MSQYPSPYPQPPYPQPQIDFSYYAPQADLLAPARRAAILQAILGGLLLLCGVCVGAIPWVVDVGEIIAQSGMTLPQMPPGVSPEEMVRGAYTLIGVVGGLVGVALVVLSVFVRHGGRGPAVTSIVLQALVVLVLALNFIGGLMQMASNPLAGITTLLMLGVLIGLFGLNIAWLTTAARSAAQISMVRQQYQAQYHQYHQQQQAYAYTGGYGPPLAPPQGYGYSGQVSPGAYPPPVGGTSAPAAPQDVTDPNRPPQSGQNGPPQTPPA